MTDTTRVSAFKMSRDVSGRVWPESGVKTPFHPCSHHGETPARVAEFAKLNRYHVSLIPYFLERLKNTPLFWNRLPLTMLVLPKTQRSPGSIGGATFARPS